MIFLLVSFVFKNDQKVAIGQKKWVFDIFKRLKIDEKVAIGQKKWPFAHF